MSTPPTQPSSPPDTTPNRKRRRAILFLVGVVALASAFIGWVVAVPFPSEALRQADATSTLIVDREGRMLREVLNPEEGRLRWHDLDSEDDELELETIIRATIHAEDKRFHSHYGFDPVAIARSMVYNVQKRRVVTGASTITQQTVKLLLHANQPRTLSRKLSELIDAVRLERTISKREILEQYLNRAPYGNQLFGIEAASWMYFACPPEDLSLAQAALLAGLPQSPSILNPYRFPKRAKTRQEQILRAMYERGAISEKRYNRARTETLRFHPKQGTLKAPHFTDYVIQTYPEFQRTYSATTSIPPKHPAKLKTTLDLPTQEMAEGIVRNRVERLQDRGVTQAAAIVLDTQSGDILAYVGSRDYWDRTHQGANDGVRALRQPGSTLKPFIYGLYMEQGGTAADVFLDQKTEFKVKDGVYIPMNYDRRFYGPVRLRDALGSSLNVPAVQAATEVGIGNVLERLRAVGLRSLTQSEEHYGPGIALGDGEVRLIDLAGAYTALGRLGEYRPPRAIRAFETEGVPLDSTTTILDPDVARILLDILSDDQARAKGFGVAGPLMLPYRVAAKTGTSTNFRDNWAVGVTPEYTVGVWVGNFDGSITKDVSGVVGAAPILREIFQGLYPQAAGQEDVLWYPHPDSIQKHTVCTLSGYPAGPRCPHAHEEIFVRGQRGASGGLGESGERVAGPEVCTMHRVERIDVRNGLRAGASCDAAFVRLESVLDVPPDWVHWAQEQGLPLRPEGDSPLCPTDGEGVAEVGVEERALDRAEHQVSIVTPKDGDRYIFDIDAPPGQQSLRLKARVGSERSVGEVIWRVSGRDVARVRSPFDAFWSLRRGTHSVELIDAETGRVEDRVTIDVE